MASQSVVTIPKKEYREFLVWREFRRFIPKDQLWFWTKEWQEKEREVDEDIKAGRLSGPFFSGKELIRHLKSKKRSK